MKFQKMEIISAGTDFDVIRYIAYPHIVVEVLSLTFATGRQSLLVISIRPQG